MAITLTIDSVDKTSLLAVGSLNIQDNLNHRTTASFMLIDPSGSYHPAVGEEISIVDDSITLFGGTIEELVEESPIGTDSLFTAVHCVDYNQIADRFLVAEVYEEILMGDIVKDIVDNYLASDGITYPHVEDGTTIIKALFNYQSAAQCFNELADLSGFAWYIDFDKELHFFERASNSAPFSITDTSANIRNPSVTKPRSDYRNKQYIRAGNEITDVRTESVKGDGEKRTFTVGFPLAKVPTITTSASSAQTVGIRGVDSGKQFYWQKGDPNISQDDSQTVLSSTGVVTVTYQGLFPIVIAAEDTAEITSRQTVEGGSGVYERVEDRPNIDSSAMATETANGLLRKYADIQEQVSFETDIDGLKAGQLMSINLSRFNVNDTFLLESVNATDIPPVESADSGNRSLRYQVKALSGETFGGWVDFFQRLTRERDVFAIRDTEILVKAQTLSDNISISETLTASSATFECAYVGSTSHFVGFGEVCIN